MPRQPKLLPPVELRITPSLDTSAPRLWVRRLVLWREPGDVIREIKLRPGLNIIWSPDSGDQAKEQLKRSMGHGSGKTLFCRLIRYCLGEDRFAPEEQRTSIALAFPKGAVGAEVVLNGAVWAIVRPLGMHRQHYAIPDGDLDNIIAGKVGPTGIEPFLEAVESGILTPDVASLVPGDRPFQSWLVALAWLARDQECRFDKALVWRSSDSESRSPARSLSSQKTLQALRALIGAITPEECRLHEGIAQLETRHKKSGLEIGHNRWEVRKTKTHILSQLGLRREDVPNGSLAAEFLRKAAREGLTRVASVDKDTDVEDLEKLRDAGAAADQQVDALSKELAVIDAQMPEIERLLTMMKGELPSLSFSVHKAENPHCPICEVPIDRALAEGCKISHKLPDLGEVRARWKQLKEDIEQDSYRYRDLKDRRASIGKKLPDVLQRAEELKIRVRSIELAREKRAEDWYSARRLIDEVERLNDLIDTLERLQSRVDRQYEKLEAERELTGAFRKAQANVFNQLSHFFDAIIRKVAGPGAEGKATLGGNGLRLVVKLGGERSTPAINTLKVIVFDLAVLCMSMEGQTNIPAFLIHDSPREADLGLSIYHQLFHLMQDLEQVGNQPLFQYIVTTTTRPPDELLKQPWLVSTLRGAPGDARLMRQDL